MKICLFVVCLLNGAAAFVGTRTPASPRGDALRAANSGETTTSFDRRGFFSTSVASVALASWAGAPTLAAAKEKRLNAAAYGGGNTEAREELRQKEQAYYAQFTADRAKKVEEKKALEAEFLTRRKQQQQESIAAFSKERAKLVNVGADKKLKTLDAKILNGGYEAKVEIGKLDAKRGGK